MRDWEDEDRDEGPEEPSRGSHWEKREGAGWNKLEGKVDAWVLVEDATGAWIRWSMEPKN